MKKYRQDKQDCMKRQTEEEHIVIIQLEAPQMRSLNQTSPIFENKIPSDSLFSILPASTRVH